MACTRVSIIIQSKQYNWNCNQRSSSLYLLIYFNYLISSLFCVLMCKCIWLYTCIFPYTCVEIREQVTGPVFFTLFAGIELRLSAGYFFFKKILLLCVYGVCMWSFMHVCEHACRHMYGGQRTTLQSWFSLSTFSWVPGIRLRFSSL